MADVPADEMTREQVKIERLEARLAAVVQVLDFAATPGIVGPDAQYALNIVRAAMGLPTVDEAPSA